MHVARRGVPWSLVSEEVILKYRGPRKTRELSCAPSSALTLCTAAVCAAQAITLTSLAASRGHWVKQQPPLASAVVVDCQLASYASIEVLGLCLVLFVEDDVRKVTKGGTCGRSPFRFHQSRARGFKGQ